EYFTEVIVGESYASRSDYTASENDNFLVQGVGGDRAALGYFGYAYYIEGGNRVKALAVDGGNGCVEPTTETIQEDDYAPLSRPLFIYVNAASLERPAVAEFVRFFMHNGAALAEAVGYVAQDE